MMSYGKSPAGRGGSASPRRGDSSGGRALPLQRLTQPGLCVVVERALEHGAAVLTDSGEHLVGRRAVDEHDHRGRARLELLAECLEERIVYADIDHLARDPA